MKGHTRSTLQLLHVIVDLHPQIVDVVRRILVLHYFEVHVQFVVRQVCLVVLISLWNLALELLTDG